MPTINKKKAIIVVAALVATALLVNIVRSCNKSGADGYEYDQVTAIFTQVTGGEVVDGFAILSTSTPSGMFLAAGSMVDNRTGDGTTIPMMRIQ